MTDNEKILSDYDGSPVVLIVLALVFVAAVIYVGTWMFFTVIL